MNLIVVHLLTVQNRILILQGLVDLKMKYKASWVGAGTGIGKSLADTLAGQGLNVVLVSLPDKVFEETTEELKKEISKPRVSSCSS
jgi:short-subunit dehydrogenase